MLIGCHSHSKQGKARQSGPLPVAAFVYRAGSLPGEKQGPPGVDATASEVPVPFQFHP